MRDYTVIIPTYNMGPFLKRVYESIADTPFAECVEEIIYVCEKSSDGSEQVIADIQKAHGARMPKVTMIQPDQRRGTFYGRYVGAKAAKTRKLMFIDSRSTLKPESAAALPQLIEKYPALLTNIEIDVEKNIFCLYWQRTHETIFRTTYKAKVNVHTIDASNFSQNMTGATCFFCSREPYVRISEKYLPHLPLYSDDTLLFADLVKEEPFTIPPELRIEWEPRNEAWPFIKHLYTRGPGLAQYHYFRKRGLLFYLTLLGLTFVAAVAVLLFINPIWAIGLFALGFLALFLSTALFAKSPVEFLRLAPLHVASIVAYGLGGLRGAWIVWRTHGVNAGYPELIPQK